MRKVRVRLTGPGYDFSIDLFSKYTSILGVDSGEGKTWLFETVQSHKLQNRLKIECEYPVIFPSITEIGELLLLNEPTVIFCDEINVNLLNDLQERIINSPHLIVSIGRATPFHFASPLKGIYQVLITGDETFDVKNINYDSKLPICDSLDGVDVVVTEASPDKSESALFKEYCKVFNKNVEIIDACGKDNVPKKLRYLTRTKPNSKIVVLTDLGNISIQFKQLFKQCSENPNISFYPWDSFEELLCKCKFVIINGNKVPEMNVFSYLSVEKYYEALLEVMTAGKSFQFKHEKPIVPSCYFVECSECKKCSASSTNKSRDVLDSEIGELLYKFFTKKEKTKEMDFFK